MHRMMLHRPLCPAVNLNDGFGCEKALREMCHRCCAFGSWGQPRSTALPKTGSGTELIQQMTSPTVLSWGHCNSIILPPPPSPTRPRQLLCAFIHGSSWICFSVPFALYHSTLCYHLCLLWYVWSFAQYQCERDLAEKFCTPVFFLVVWQHCVLCNVIGPNQTLTGAVVLK